jgi:hypothetical protein
MIYTASATTAFEMLRHSDRHGSCASKQRPTILLQLVCVRLQFHATVIDCMRLHASPSARALHTARIHGCLQSRGMPVQVYVGGELRLLHLFLKKLMLSEETLPITSTI